MKKRFGEFLICKNAITREQLIEAITLQVNASIEHDRHIPIGMILVEDMELLTRQEILQYLKMYKISPNIEHACDDDEEYTAVLDENEINALKNLYTKED